MAMKAHTRRGPENRKRTLHKFCSWSWYKVLCNYKYASYVTKKDSEVTCPKCLHELELTNRKQDEDKMANSTTDEPRSNRSEYT